MAQPKDKRKRKKATVQSKTKGGRVEGHVATGKGVGGRVKRYVPTKSTGGKKDGQGGGKKPVGKPPSKPKPPAGKPPKGKEKPIGNPGNVKPKGHAGEKEDKGMWPGGGEKGKGDNKKPKKGGKPTK